MSNIKILEEKVRNLYEAKDPNRDEWCDWLYPNHVIVVADYATKLATRFEIDQYLSRAAALLHDIADVQMSRFNNDHEEESLNIATKLLRESNFTEDEIEIIVDDALKFHSCHNGQRPKTDVGKILSTADSLGHLDTNFYIYSTTELMKDRPKTSNYEWARKKLERDFNDKIQFTEVREELRPKYEKLKKHFNE